MNRSGKEIKMRPALDKKECKVLGKLFRKSSGLKLASLMISDIYLNYRSCT